MQQHICNLLVLVLGTSSIFIVTPSQAQTPDQSDSQNTSNVSSTSSNSPSATQLSDFADFTNNKPPILAEAASKSSAANADITATKPQPRIPIFSRIFPITSMQQ